MRNDTATRTRRDPTGEAPSRLGALGGDPVLQPPPPVTEVAAVGRGRERERQTEQDEGEPRAGQPPGEQPRRTRRPRRRSRDRRRHDLADDRRRRAEAGEDRARYAMTTPIVRTARDRVGGSPQRPDEHERCRGAGSGSRARSSRSAGTGRRRRRSARCVADASSTLAGSFFASAGLIDCNAERIEVDVCWASMSTRRAARASKTCSCAADGELADRVLDRRGGDRGRDRVGDHRAGRGDEVRRTGEAERRLVRDVVAHLGLLGRLGDDVGEAVVVDDPSVEPPADAGEHEQHAPDDGEQSHHGPGPSCDRHRATRTRCSRRGILASAGGERADVRHASAGTGVSVDGAWSASGIGSSARRAGPAAQAEERQHRDAVHRRARCPGPPGNRSTSPG